jgi:diacylglycerol diphosphate phosphatase / phosphatidate phosphatase
MYSLIGGRSNASSVILSLALTGAITNVFKVTAGRPRPDLIDRVGHLYFKRTISHNLPLKQCQPAAGSANAAVYGLVDYTICTQTDNSILQDGFRSLISGHASRKHINPCTTHLTELFVVSFAGLGFLSYYLSGKLHLWG